MSQQLSFTKRLLLQIVNTVGAFPGQNLPPHLRDSVQFNPESNQSKWCLDLFFPLTIL